MATASHQVLPLCCSAFLRPTEAFAALKAWVIEDLLDRAMGARPVRIWIPACGTGEEAYSLAIVLLEHFATYGRELNVRIFATDREANSIEVARAGVYAESDLSQLTAERLQQFFQRLGPGRYRVSAQLRECIVFARHDLERDPPLSLAGFCELPQCRRTTSSRSGVPTCTRCCILL